MKDSKYNSFSDAINELFNNKHLVDNSDVIWKFNSEDNAFRVLYNGMELGNDISRLKLPWRYAEEETEYLWIGVEIKTTNPGTAAEKWDVWCTDEEAIVLCTDDDNVTYLKTKFNRKRRS